MLAKTLFVNLPCIISVHHNFDFMSIKLPVWCTGSGICVTNFEGSPPRAEGSIKAGHVPTPSVTGAFLITLTVYQSASCTLFTLAVYNITTSQSSIWQAEFGTTFHTVLVAKVIGVCVMLQLFLSIFSSLRRGACGSENIRREGNVHSFYWCCFMLPSNLPTFFSILFAYLLIL